MNRMHLCVLWLVLASTQAPAQVVGPPVRADVNNPASSVEPTIAVSATNPDDLVVGYMDLRQHPTPLIQTGYSVSLNGAASFTTNALAPMPAGISLSGDPFVATDGAGDLFLGGFGPEGIFVSRKPAGAATVNAPSLVYGPPPPDALLDKPLMTANLNDIALPISVSFVEKLGKTSPCQGYFVRLCRGDGAAWAPPTPVGPGCGAMGQCPVPLWMDTVLPGRLVVVYLGLAATPLRFEARYSVDGGLTWAGPAEVFAPGSGYEVPALGSDLPGGTRWMRALWPSAALDRATGHIYVAAMGRASAGAPNLDLWVARSTDGGATFGTTLHITDEMLGASSEDAPDQCLPAIAVDGEGGVNLVYYDTRHQVIPDSSVYANLDAYYLRITGFGTPSQDLQPFRLTPSTFRTDAAPTFELSSSGVQFLGDYLGIAASGCRVYPCYIAVNMATDPPKRTLYVHRVDACGGDSTDP